jgi:hypothetical protein
MTEYSNTRVIFVVGLVIASQYLLRKVWHKKITQTTNLYQVYLIVALTISELFRLASAKTIAIPLLSNILIVPSCIAVYTFAYLFCCWAKLFAGASPQLYNRKFREPSLFVISFISFLFLIPAFADPAITRVALFNLHEALLIPTQFLYYLQSHFVVSGFFLLTLIAIIRATSREGLGLEDKLLLDYRKITFIPAVGLILAYFGTGYASIIIYALTKDKAVLSFTEGIINIIVIVEIFFLALVRFDKELSNIYKKRRFRKLLSKTVKLEIFYQRTLQIFPASYRLNPFAPGFLTEQDSPELLISTLVLQLNNVRTRIWRTEVWRKAKETGKSVEVVVKETMFTRNEAEIWKHYLVDGRESPTKLRDLSQLPNPDKNVPSMPLNNGVENAVDFYLQLAKKIKLA